MASKAFKRKQRVKEFKSGNAPQNQKLNVRRIILISLVVLAVVFLVVLFATKKPFTPGIESSPMTGPVDAKVTFIEFGCYTCPYTKQFNTQTLPQLMREYNGKVNFVFRSVPIYRNAGANLAHEAALCANEQGKFWEYSNQLFLGPSQYDENLLRSYTEMLGMEQDTFNNCVSSRRYKDKVRADYSDAKKAGVATTPTVFINGFKVVGAHDVQIYRNIIDNMLEN